MRVDENILEISGACATFFITNANKKIFDLESEGQVTVYTNRNGHILWQISTSIQVIPEQPLLALIVFQIYHNSNFVTLKTLVKIMMYTFAVADSKYLT